LAEHFAKKIYGGLKGTIRLEVIWRDLQPTLAILQQRFGPRLRILDIGAGLGQLSLRLAQQGHNIVVNDISTVMLEKAKHNARQHLSSVQWLACPYQDLVTQHHLEPFHLILCHALLEWLADPEELIPTISELCVPEGTLSLCFYNPDSIIYRNLIMGNFNWLEQHTSVEENQEENTSPQQDQKSLTPVRPCTRKQVQTWLENSGFSITSSSGLRVFHDYVVNKRGGHAIPEEVLKMELMYSQQEPYKWLGRYIHFLANKKNPMA